MSVEMRKEIAAARRLEAQSLAERRGIDGDQQQVLDPGKVARGRFDRLGRRFGSKTGGAVNLDKPADSTGSAA